MDFTSIYTWYVKSADRHQQTERNWFETQAGKNIRILKRSVMFLGHVTFDYGIVTDHEKVKAVSSNFRFRSPSLSRFVSLISTLCTRFCWDRVATACADEEELPILDVFRGSELIQLIEDCLHNTICADDTEQCWRIHRRYRRFRSDNRRRPVPASTRS